MDPHVVRSGARPDRPAPPGRRRWLAGLLGSLTLAAAFGIAQDAGARPSKHKSHHPREKTYIKRTWGIEVMFVRRTAAGSMLEFRYRVLDADKAKPLFDRGTKPVLIHAESGAELIVPTPAKTGALRNSNTPVAGRTYWMFFANPGKLVKRGDHVTIEIGKFRVEGIVVQ